MAYRLASRQPREWKRSPVPRFVKTTTRGLISGDCVATSAAGLQAASTLLAPRIAPGSFSHMGGEDLQDRFSAIQ